MTLDDTTKLKSWIKESNYYPKTRYNVLQQTVIVQ